MPELKTGMTTGADIATARLKVSLKGHSNILISSDEVFSDPSKYFVINLDRKDKYEDGHISGSCQV